MNVTPSQPRHPSYQRHRRQVVWQIVVPVVVAALVIVAVLYLLVTAAFGGGGDVSRWAAISTIWLTLPVMIAAFLILAVLVAITVLLVKVQQFIPPYSRRLQRLAFRIDASAKRTAHIVRRPMLIFPELGGLIRRGMQRLRSG